MFWRCMAVALVATTLVWGRPLLPHYSLSTKGQVEHVNPRCQVGGTRLDCISPRVPHFSADAGATSWIEIAADEYFAAEERAGREQPSWNPYVGSGQPIVFDGINTPTSPTRWFLHRFPGDGGRDALVFARMLLFTFGTTLAVALAGATGATLVATGLGASLAPVAASYVDIVFLDVDLLAPWPLVLALALARSFPLAAALILSVAFGMLVSSLGFLQSQFVFASVVGVYSLAAARATRGRSLLAGGAVALGLVIVLPTQWPLIAHLPDLASQRDLLCMTTEGPGWETFGRLLLQPSLGRVNLADGVTAVGLVLMLATIRRWRYRFPFVVLVLLVWVAVAGLPEWTCRLEGISGIRWWRHLRAHVDVAFLFGVAVSLEACADGAPRLRRATFLLGIAGAGAIAAAATGRWPEVLAGLVAIAAILGAGALLSRDPAPLRGARRVGYVSGLALLALAPFALANAYLPAMLRSGPMRQLPPLPTTVSEASPFGRVRDLSQREDRRHYAGTGILHPNWPAALGILDMRSLGALYTRPGHDLDSGLFDHWLSSTPDPDRFVRPNPETETRSVEFQRVLVVNRVSLLTFLADRVFFPAAPSPYSMDRCRPLAERDGVVSFFCPDVGSVGYFPDRVRRAESVEEALEQLRAASPEELIGLVVIGPRDGEPPPSDLVPASGRVLSVDRTGDTLEYVLDVDRAGVFVVADHDFPGWSATLDDRPTPILRANVGFKAFAVPEGRVRLSLRFDPT